MKSALPQETVLFHANTPDSQEPKYWLILKAGYATRADAEAALDQFERQVEQNKIGADFDRFLEMRSGEIRKIEGFKK